jgi:hypothetical protein
MAVMLAWPAAPLRGLRGLPFDPVTDLISIEPHNITVNEYDLLALPRRGAPGEKIIRECANSTARWVLENSYRGLRPATRDIRLEYDRQ